MDVQLCQSLRSYLFCTTHTLPQLAHFFIARTSLSHVTELLQNTKILKLLVGLCVCL